MNETDGVLRGNSLGCHKVQKWKRKAEIKSSLMPPDRRIDVKAAQ